MSPSTYVDSPGEIVVRYPIQSEQVKLTVFLVPANDVAVKKLLDRMFNVPSGGKVRFEPMPGVIAVVCADIGKAYSLDKEHRNWGWSIERDYGFWVPMVGGPAQDGRGLDGRFAWYLPYVWVNNFAAVAVGREAYGFPKQMAALIAPGDDTPSGVARAFGAEALVIDKHLSSTQAGVKTVFTIEPTSSAPTGRGSAWDTPNLAAWEIVENGLFRDLLRLTSDRAVKMFHFRWIRDLITRTVRMIFVKQFRGISDPRACCHQSIVEVPTRLTKWYAEGGFLPQHELRIRPCDSHPIVTDLGLSGPTVAVPLAWWTRIDFCLDPGSTLCVP